MTLKLPPSSTSGLVLVNHSARRGRGVPNPAFHRETFSAVISVWTMGTIADSSLRIVTRSLTLYSNRSPSWLPCAALMLFAAARKSFASAVPLTAACPGRNAPPPVPLPVPLPRAPAMTPPLPPGPALGALKAPLVITRPLSGESPAASVEIIVPAWVCGVAGSLAAWARLLAECNKAGKSSE